MSSRSVTAERTASQYFGRRKGQYAKTAGQCWNQRQVNVVYFVHIVIVVAVAIVVDASMPPETFPCARRRRRPETFPVPVVGHSPKSYPAPVVATRKLSLCVCVHGIVDLQRHRKKTFPALGFPAASSQKNIPCVRVPFVSTHAHMQTFPALCLWDSRLAACAHRTSQ